MVNASVSQAAWWGDSPLPGCPGADDPDHELALALGHPGQFGEADAENPELLRSRKTFSMKYRPRYERTSWGLGPARGGA